MARAKTSSGRAPLLVELLTEELPPKSLKALQRFADALYASLIARQFASPESQLQRFATPRRLAALVDDVAPMQQDRVEAVRGPKTSALYRDGQPVEAIVSGLARKYGLSNQELLAKARVVADPKGDFVEFDLFRPGAALDDAIDDIVMEAIEVVRAGAKTMRWGDADAEFLRPVHRLTVLHGKTSLRAQALGLQSGSVTRGHRFMGRDEIRLKHAREYADRLDRDGSVIASFDARRRLIIEGLDAAAGSSNWRFGDFESLLDEVTGLVEYPVIYTGTFDDIFLKVPKECLTISMRQHQKYFPLEDIAGNVLPRFLFVSNIAVAQPQAIIDGNQRVLRARLSDAKFFYDQDRKMRLDQRVARLEQVVYHNRLGSQLERVKRITKLAGVIAPLIGANLELVRRAAYLSKADLLTEMVGEFPELQGVMGRYYARHDAEPREVADALEEHYFPRHAGDRLPGGKVAQAVGLADRFDGLAGMFAIGQIPTGDKDPFGLRRHALGIARMLIEIPLALDLKHLIAAARAQLAGELAASPIDAELHAFIIERVRGYLRERGYHSDEIEAVLVSQPSRLDLIVPRIDAVRAFRSLDEAQSLAAANKRIRNLLKKASVNEAEPRRELMAEAAEQTLFDDLARLTPEVDQLLESGAYDAALRLLAQLRPAVDTFFDSVMVMADEVPLRENRLRLLAKLNGIMNRVADISVLEPGAS